ncbi:lyase family protein [Agromyces archimandritae]|uniref:Adenylosuccinate lyase n=1 Tax=Agromyces archimandritae TaxID=2781962 RepID=A0A975FLB4_9MICO|nr:lyase family protein [Agromyces archimandritae]QTX03842.1 adenylosuccinate lyase [Agromyces archimandritae]
MSSEREPAPVFDVGLLSPASADAAVSDEAIARALVQTERALLAAYVRIGCAPAGVLGEFDERLRRRMDAVSAPVLAAAAGHGGNPVIPLVGALREAVAGTAAAEWLHRGATSQDILDTAVVLQAARALAEADAALARVEAALAAFVARYRATPAAAHTLTQHSVPTTLGARYGRRLEAIADARARMAEAGAALPAQLGGASGTLASFVEIAGADGAERLAEAFAAELGLRAAAPWHTSRTPVLRVASAAAETVAALAAFAGDVALGARTESGELAEASGGGSSAMPQKRNPVRAVLVRAAGQRMPGLVSTVHLAAAEATDERPDGAWHAELPAFREALRVLLGAASGAAELAEGLRVDEDRVAANLAITGPLAVSERLMLVLGPQLGRGRVQELVDRAVGGEDLAALLAAEPGVRLDEAGIAALLDPAEYLGLAPRIADRAVRRAGEQPGRATASTPDAAAAPAEHADGRDPASTPEPPHEDHA